MELVGRTLRQLIDHVKSFEEQKLMLCPYNINTQAAQGRFIFNLFASLAEFEQDITGEHTQARPSADRVRGRKGGRPKGLGREEQLKAE